MPDAPDAPDEEPSASVPGLPDLDALDALGGGDLDGLLQQAQQIMAAQQLAASREVEGVAGGGAVRIRATGTGDMRSVTIDREVVDPDDVGMLEDLVLAALHDVNERLREVQREAMGPFGNIFGT